MSLSNEDRACLWLSEANISVNIFERILKYYNSAYELYLNYDTDKKELFNLEQISALDKSRNTLNKNIESMEENNISILNYSSEKYPTKLNKIKDKPYALFYKGNIDILNRTCISIIGTRHPSFYGKKIATLIAKELSKIGVCVISGMAIGIDSCAHEGAISENCANTCAVCGCGLNIDYPVSNRELKDNIIKRGGLLLSEYTPDMNARSYFFPYRNRIISGLSDAVVFVEGDVHSGGMLTVDRAIEQDRPVYAVPGNIDSRFSTGPNHVISTGVATAISSIDDFILSLNINVNNNIKEEKDDSFKSELDTKQLNVYNIIQEYPSTIEEIAYKTKLEASEVQEHISYLEIMGYIQRAGGGRYSI